MNLVSLPHPKNFLIVEALDYPNPYDYKTPHRHDYFEIILIKESGGEQLIDFVKTPLHANTIYAIYPRQIHLLKRERAQGLILQFRKDIFEFIFPIQHHYLYFPQADLRLSQEQFEHLYAIVQQVLSLNQNGHLSSLSIHKSYSYLQIFLISLIELHQKQVPQHSHRFAGQFLQLLSQHIKEKCKVADYAELMHLSTDKLSAQCKEAFGTTPLKLIHEERILEIKRHMVLGELSLKEIAYEMNFENTANFSAFVKMATEYTPSELQHELQRMLT